MGEEGGHEGVPGAAEGAFFRGVQAGCDGAVGGEEGGGVDVDSVAVYEGCVGAFPGCDAAAAAAEEEGGVLDPEGSEAVCVFLISDVFSFDGRERWDGMKMLTEEISLSRNNTFVHPRIPQLPNINLHITPNQHHPLPRSSVVK